LYEAIPKDATQATIASSKGFPAEAPFRIRIDNEFLTVTAVNGNTWTVQRGIERTFAEPHEAGTSVEQFPLLPHGEEQAQAASALWARSLFTKPAPVSSEQPRLASALPPAAIRGRAWNWKLDIAGWNPAFGAPNFELLSAPPGMELNERTGGLRWRVGEQAELGKHPIEVLVWGTNGKSAGFTPTVNVLVREPNQRPQFEPAGPLRFFIGRESKVRLAAKDPDGDSAKLKYSLEEGPAGMTIDAQTGELRWSPGEDLAPQELTVSVKATDADDLPESVTARIPVTLAEDSARFAYLTGSVTRSTGVKEAWIYDRATNKTTVIHAGDRFQIADFDLSVESIGPTYVLLKRGDQTFRLAFEQALTQMTPVAAPAQPAPVNFAPPSDQPSAPTNPESPPAGPAPEKTES
jgi:hypothetical protein